MLNPILPSNPAANPKRGSLNAAKRGTGVDRPIPGVEAMLVAGGAGPSEGLDTFDDVASKDQFRENLRAAAELQIREDGKDGIRLNGGPMDGWLVLKDAPSLAADWYKTWPSGMASENEPGRYEVADSGTWAEWVSLDRGDEANLLLGTKRSDAGPAL